MRKPNIILINCDDLGYGDLGCYGSVKNDTPVLDKLAGGGMRFTDFYAASPVCSPSRAALLTGCYPPRINFGDFDGDCVLFPGHDIGLHPDEVTIARLLKDVGYATMMVGKWHVGDQECFLPTSHGFDDYYGIPFSNDMGRMAGRESAPPLPLVSGNTVIQEQPDQTSITERYTEKCVSFIREKSGQPFFLYLGHMHVHLPLYAADVFVRNSRNGDYGACVMAIDWSTGVIADELKRQGVWDDTLILFTSDNGSRNDFGESNGVLRGAKASTWEGGQRVPLIAHWPGMIQPGVCSGLASMMDLYPTLAAIGGAQVPQDRIIDGLDISDLMFTEGAESPRDTFFYFWMDTLEAVRVGDYKLFVSRHVPGGADVCVRELYNLADDPGENDNVYDEHPDIVGRLMEMVENCRVCKDTRPAGRVENARPLTEYREDHPYIIAMYDREEIG